MAKKNKPSKLGDVLKNINKQTIKDASEKERQKSYDIREIFQQMELDLITSMRKAFYFHKREEAKEGFSWEQWQLSKLRAIEEYRKRNRGIVDSYSKPIQKAINEELKGNFRKGENRFVAFSKRLLERVKRFFGIKEDIKLDAELGLPNDIAQDQMTVRYIDKVLGRERKPPADNDFFGVNEKKLEALQKVVEQDIQKSQYSVLRKMDDVYRQTIYRSQVYMQGGFKSLDNIDMATKDFLDKGLNSIIYKDGKKVNIASYAEMCLRTASQRATFLGEAKKRDEWGIYLVVVSAHANTCKMCMPWQGKVLIDDVFSHPSKEFIEANGQYALLSEAIKAGLLHPNCRHSLITYFPGVTQIPTIPDGDKAVELYEIEQEQRSLERQLRKWKRVEAGSVDAKNVNYAAKKIKLLEGKLKELLDKNRQLRRAPEREVDRTIIENTDRSDILSNRKWLKASFSTQKKFDKHIEKHLHEYGNITAEEYLNISRDLLAAPLSKDVEGFVSKEGFIFKYRNSTNDFAIGRLDGKISTLYKPKEGYEYWLGQIRDYKE
ncbi:phage minor capsid protein [Clostridium intestinale]|uniref:Capsid protein n=1 Tax=Clostridium intestinale TaxID=36845 RepID=A0A7D6VZ95_9CLOT|nr:phage minor capsid protein [Clostridium intestinale]QLY79191.1 capsid protein [Clostridium intestinale]